VSTTDLCLTSTLSAVGRFESKPSRTVLGRRVRAAIDVRGSWPKSLSEVDDAELRRLVTRCRSGGIGTTDHPPTKGRLGSSLYAVKPHSLAGRCTAKGEAARFICTVAARNSCYPLHSWAESGESTGLTEADSTTAFRRASSLPRPALLDATSSRSPSCATKLALALPARVRGQRSTVFGLQPSPLLFLFVRQQRELDWREAFEDGLARYTRAPATIDAGLVARRGGGLMDGLPLGCVWGCIWQSARDLLGGVAGRVATKR